MMSMVIMKFIGRFYQYQINIAAVDSGLLVVVYGSYPFVVFGKRSRDDVEDLNTLQIRNIGLYNLVFSFICNWSIGFIHEFS